MSRELLPRGIVFSLCLVLLSACTGRDVEPAKAPACVKDAASSSTKTDCPKSDADLKKDSVTDTSRVGDLYPRRSPIAEESPRISPSPESSTSSDPWSNLNPSTSPGSQTAPNPLNSSGPLRSPTASPGLTPGRSPNSIAPSLRPSAAPQSQQQQQTLPQQQQQIIQQQQQGSSTPAGLPQIQLEVVNAAGTGGSSKTETKITFSELRGIKNVQYRYLAKLTKKDFSPTRELSLTKNDLALSIIVQFLWNQKSCQAEGEIIVAQKIKLTPSCR